MAGRLIGLLPVLLAAGLLVFGCRNEEPAPPPPRLAPEVTFVEAHPQDVPFEGEWIGQSEAYRTVEIRSQVTGIIKERYFIEGTDVKKGARLYLIDPVPFRAALNSAKAKVAQAEARLTQASQNVARLKPLLPDKAVSRKDVDDAVSEELSAKANVEAAKAELDKAEFDLNNTLIVAPIAGRVDKSKLPEGRLVSAQTDLLTTIQQLNPMYVNWTFPESQVLEWLKGTASGKIQDTAQDKIRVVAVFNDGTVYPREGLFNFSDVRFKSDTGAIDARAEFPNPDKDKFFAGQFVKVRLKGLKLLSVFLVPQRAVQQGPKGPMVMIVGPGDKVDSKAVKATAWLGDQWLVEQGLASGDRVIVDGLQSVMPGMAVRPVAAKAGGQAGTVQSVADADQRG
ncbi:MAG: efflux RND transporter periplasmic adaptor subunit [Nitrospirota bacterium]|nr:efflux RND transporter periplasmic adaptor subunit [Nitrospirota bacterium]